RQGLAQGVGANRSCHPPTVSTRGRLRSRVSPQLETEGGTHRCAIPDRASSLPPTVPDQENAERSRSPAPAFFGLNRLSSRQTRSRSRPSGCRYARIV